MASASVAELRDALRENLDRSGVLKELRAKVRASIYTALSSEAVHRPELSSENLVLNELIRDYLIYNGYRETLSVFIPESGQPEVRPFDRSFLREHLNMQEGPNSQQLPLLYALTAARRQAPGPLAAAADGASPNGAVSTAEAGTQL